VTVSMQQSATLPSPTTTLLEMFTDCSLSLGQSDGDYLFSPPTAAAHSYDAAAGAPPLYRGYVGYEHSGKLFSPAVTVTDIPGATLFSTQSNNKPVWS